MRRAVILVVFITLLTCAYAWAEEGTLTNGETAVITPQTKDDTVFLKEGDNNDDVKYLQTRLGELCYLMEDADGAFGAKTAAALMKFQRDAGLSETGVADTQTITALDRADAPVNIIKQGAQGDDVKWLQEKLIGLFYMSGTADGVFGEGTTNALIAFQRANELIVNGIVDTATHEALSDPNAVPGILGVGSSGEAVKTIQERLVELNYLDAEPDGSYGEKTAEAVRNFQRVNGMTQTGGVDAATRAVLEDEKTPMLILPLKRGDKSAAVKTLQKKAGAMRLAAIRSQRHL